jgi:ATP/maltotriose-dependent transcriptional regulator MalT
MDLSLSAADVTALAQRSEGWSAGLPIRFPAFTGETIQIEGKL